MELDFDKEIDAILRNARRDGPVYVGDAAAAPHLDADVIAAFAENALPEKSRALYMAHMADCDRCRKILSNQLVLNAEAAPIAAAAAAPSVITIAERSVPWYTQLFAFRNLAYVMGGLVLVFGGFLAFTVIQRSGMSDTVATSGMPQAEPRGDSSAETSTGYSDTNMSANAAANVTASNALNGAADANATAVANRPIEPGVSGPRIAEQNMSLDGVDAAGTGTGNPPPPPPAVAAAKPEDRERDDSKLAEAPAASAQVQDVAKNDATLKQQQYGNVPSQSGPMRNSEQQYQRQLENMDRRATAKRAPVRAEEESSGRRSVGGRTFERKQNVWYDVNYQGRPTINVRRGSEEFNRLDGGLRSIANSLSGTVVVVWGAKAYRID